MNTRLISVALVIIFGAAIYAGQIKSDSSTSLGWGKRYNTNTGS